MLLVIDRDASATNRNYLTKRAQHRFARAVGQFSQNLGIRCRKENDQIKNEVRYHAYA